jgi:uncharacterized protein YdaU (DUF1376 family)
MNYYEHHIGDYDKSTSHLTACEDGIYCRLLRRYYDTEAPLPSDLSVLQRLVRARTKEEKAAVKTVLAEFFTLANDGWHQGHCDKHIKKVQEKSEKARRSAGLRWKAQCERNANASETHGERNALQAPSTKHQERAEAGDACPHEEIIALYHDLLPANPRIKSWTGGRQANLRTRWREDAKRQSLDYWQRFFAHVASSPFLTGQVEDRNGRPFLPGLDWLVKPDNFAKVIENRYHDRRTQ